MQNISLRCEHLSLRQWHSFRHTHTHPPVTSQLTTAHCPSLLKASSRPMHYRTQSDTWTCTVNYTGHTHTHTHTHIHKHSVLASGYEREGSRGNIILLLSPCRRSWWETAEWARPLCWFSWTRASSSRGPSPPPSALDSQWVHTSVLHAPSLRMSPSPPHPPHAVDPTRVIRRTCCCVGLKSVTVKLIYQWTAAWVGGVLQCGTMHLLTAFITTTVCVCVCVCVCVLLWLMMPLLWVSRCGDTALLMEVMAAGCLLLFYVILCFVTWGVGGGA